MGDEHAPEPAGFGNCAQCAYLTGGPPGTCFACASASFAALPGERCEVCERALQDGHCGNALCKRTESERHFNRVWAVSLRTGALQRAIDRYKVQGKVAWARIFGRVLLGYLDANAETFSRYDLIVASPTFVGPGGRDFDHTGAVLGWARMEDDGAWPITNGVIEKTCATTRFRDKSWQERRRIAETELRPALAVLEPDLVRRARVLVYDDVFTEGLTLREVAGALKGAGAVEVSAIVLARQPFGG